MNVFEIQAPGPGPAGGAKPALTSLRGRPSRHRLWAPDTQLLSSSRRPRVTDERTGHKTGDIQRVMNGEFDDFIDELPALAAGDRKHQQTLNTMKSPLIAVFLSRPDGLRPPHCTAAATRLLLKELGRRKRARARYRRPCPGPVLPSGETNLGDLVADAVRNRTGKRSGRRSSLPTRLTAKRESVAPGKTDPPGTIVSTPPALRRRSQATPLVVLNLTGAQLLKVAERSVSRAPQPFDGFLQVSGLQIRYSPSQPEGKRVSSLVGIRRKRSGRRKDLQSRDYPASSPVAAWGTTRYGTKKDIADDTACSAGEESGQLFDRSQAVQSTPSRAASRRNNTKRGPVGAGSRLSGLFSNDTASS